MLASPTQPLPQVPRLPFHVPARVRRGFDHTLETAVLSCFSGDAGRRVGLAAGPTALLPAWRPVLPQLPLSQSPG